MLSLPMRQILRSLKWSGLIVYLGLALSAQAAAPVATDDTATIAEGSASTVVNVLVNDTDADADTLTITAATYSGVGTVTFSTSSLSYEPPSDFLGQVDLTETITYTISDGNGGTDTGTV
ncbi:MAG: Ig-like domain-containing protein, partial [Betaproteobacteria bacterium]